MFVSLAADNRLRSTLCFAGLAASLATIFAAPLLHAQGTRLWTQSRLEEFEKGQPQGVSLFSNGQLREGPGLTDLLTTPSAFVWSVAAAKNGETYLGTSSPATVLRVGAGKDAPPFTLFESKDVSVQVVRLGPDGFLYAATLPSGKVYRLKPDATARQDDSTAAVVFDLSKLDNAKSDENRSRYIWDMTFDAAGRLYIATGGPGAIYRIDPSKPGSRPELFFKSDEQHIRCLAWDARGNLIAGSDGSGLVYQINPEGKGYVLFEAPRHEITSLAVAADGTIDAASVGDKTHNQLPPLPIQGAGSATITIVQPQSLQAANTSSSVPEGSEIYAITPTDSPHPQAPRKLWAAKDEIVYALADSPDGLLVLTGNRGHIFRIAADGSYADLAHLDAEQGLTLAKTEDGTLIGTGNTGKLVRLGAIEKHEYASDVLDAGTLARFGHLEVEPGSSGYQLFTRSGNVEQPIRGWSAWEPLKDGGAVSPPGRFFEWKAVLNPGGILGSVAVNYLPVNSAPVVDELIVVPGARINPQMQNQPGINQLNINISFPSNGQNPSNFDGNSSTTPLQAFKDRTAVTVRWAAHDDDNDDLTYSLYLRGDGETVWRLLKNQISEKAYSFDSNVIPDGGYQIKVVASDAPSHTPADALTGEKISDRFEVDTTPPIVSGLKAQISENQCIHSPCPQIVSISFDAEDAFSPIVRAEYSLDAGPWQFIEPVGQLSDSKHEHYSLLLPGKSIESMGEHLITVRAYDRHENIGVAKTVFTVPAK